MCEISERIACLAVSCPERIALGHEGAFLTYGQLDRAANRMASHLASLGAREGAAVALCLPRGFAQITAALAVMRTGAAYVPLDPGWPMERLRGIVADCGAQLVVADRMLAEGLGSCGAVVCPGDEAGADDVYAGGAIPAEALAYIVYTSGSAGAPKGVEITHGNLQHLIAWHTEAFGVTAADRASHLAGLGFDASVWEVWPHLAAGACVVLADDLVRTSPELLRDWLVAEGITLAFVPTPLAEPMIGMLWPEVTTLRTLLTGGDTLHTRPRAALPFRVVNNYGPAECTVVATSGVVAAEGEDAPSIGSPIRGAQVYVLNELGQRAWVGETGELYIGGDGVGRGYRNLPEQTARAFVPDHISGRPEARLYRTGDFGVQLGDGRIAFRGRGDGQEKIRGQRVELEEIVCVLGRHPGVAFCSVVTRGEGVEKRLVAYVLPAEGVVPGTRELREFLAERLPGYMVPAVYVRLQAVPLTANGKVDKATLPVPSAENGLPEMGLREASTPIEERVLGIVRQLIKREAIGVDDDFFLVGGHSLMGTQLVMRVRESFGVPLTLRDLFEGATVAQLAARVEAMLMAELGAMSEDEAARQVAT